jgi:hypothetical protein
MKHKMWYDEEKAIFREEIIGSFSTDDVPQYLDRTRELLSGTSSPQVLVDFTRASPNLYQSKEVKEKLIQGSARLQFENERVAFLVKDTAVRSQAWALALGVQGMGKKVEISWFENEQEAIAWLKGKKDST